VSEIAALCNFYTSLLVGDSTDNIKGAKGIGKAKAAKLLSGLAREEDLLAACRATYRDDAALKRNAGLLWLLSNDRKCAALEFACT
jgi:5'-3' exonuclease